MITRRRGGGDAGVHHSTSRSQRRRQRSERLNATSYEINTRNPDTIVFFSAKTRILTHLNIELTKARSTFPCPDHTFYGRPLRSDSTFWQALLIIPDHSEEALIDRRRKAQNPILTGTGNKDSAPFPLMVSSQSARIPLNIAD